VSTYTVEFTTAAQKEFDRIATKQAERIAAAIRALAGNPRPHGYKKLVGKDLYRIRVGDYRVIYAITDQIVTVTIVRVRHRKDAYD
jgi:mRNA interferase RelE/StbE